MLKEIEEYNRYDCTSTRKLRDWLICRAIDCAVPPVGAAARQGRRDRSQTTTSWRASWPSSSATIATARKPEQTAVAMISAARGYHRREDKPFWWGHFDRLNNPVDEWADNADVFIAERAEVDHRLAYATQGTQAAAVGASYRRHRGRRPRQVDCTRSTNHPSPAGLTDDTERRAFGTVTVVGCDDPAAPTEVTVVEREPKDGGPFDSCRSR